MSVRVPPLSMLIRRSIMVPFRLAETCSAGLGLEAVAAYLKHDASATL
jgi:hypothetical protein